jgi:Flp pilus assembly protein CpaB
MATRFGASSYTRTYYAKVRWLVGCMLTVILLLSTAVVYIAFSTPEPEPAVASIRPNSPELPASRPVGVLVASQRIESNARLSDDLFMVQAIDEGQLPPGVVLARDRGMIRGYYAKRMITPGSALVHADITPDSVPTVFDIPYGFRATTIMAGTQELAGGLITPPQRVDVLFTYTKDAGKTQTITLVPFVRVLSVDGHTDFRERIPLSGQQVPVSLQVTEKDAKRIELARTLGRMSLVLLGPTATPPEGGNDSPIDWRALIGDNEPADENVEPSYPGRAIISDPNTGRLITYVLTPNGWKPLFK